MPRLKVSLKFITDCEIVRYFHLPEVFIYIFEVDLQVTLKLKNKIKSKTNHTSEENGDVQMTLEIVSDFGQKMLFVTIVKTKKILLRFELKYPNFKIKSRFLQIKSIKS